MQVISGISLICFAASYGVAWVLEVSQLFRRSAPRGWLTIGFVVAGLVAQTLFLGYRAFERSGSPLSSSFDWYLLAAWLLVATYLYLAYYYPKAALGLYMLPLVLVLVTAATLADRQALSPNSASRVWGAVHGVFLLLGTVTVMVGFVAGLMYLSQARRLKRKLPSSEGIRLPSLERLAKVNSRSIILSALLVGVGFLAGMILNIIGRGESAEVPWSDPVISSSALMLVWLSAAAVFNATYRPARRGRKVAYLTIVNFVFLAIALAVLLLVETEHGSAYEPQKQPHLASRAGIHAARRAQFPDVRASVRQTGSRNLAKAPCTIEGPVCRRSFTNGRPRHFAPASSRGRARGRS